VFVVEGSNRLIVSEHKPGSSSQQFHYNKRRKTIDNDADSNKVFDVVGGQTEAGSEVCAWDYHGGDNQHWIIEPA